MAMALGFDLGFCRPDLVPKTLIPNGDLVCGRATSCCVPAKRRYVHVNCLLGAIAIGIVGVNYDDASVITYSANSSQRVICISHRPICSGRFGHREAKRYGKY